MILNKDNELYAIKLFERVISDCVEFKLKESIKSNMDKSKLKETILEELPIEGKHISEVVDEFNNKILPYCSNFSSKNFMGFPDSGNSVAAIMGAIYCDMLQQNLINQSFCSPSATFVEIAVINWLREVVGYEINSINDVWDVGGIITQGGTGSNAVAMLLARENKVKNTLEHGIKSPADFKIIIPKGIGHYSIKSSQMWLGCGDNLIEIPTKDYKMDLVELKKALEANKGKIMSVVAYVGDSRTMTIDNLQEICKIVKESDDSIWLHADACHGFSLGFSDKLRHKIKGIELFDSISTDPHKVMCTPYVISALLIKDPEKFKTITSKSDLIMQEDFAFGQITPFIGSKNWSSLKLWFLLKNIGKKGMGEIIDKRHELAKFLHKTLQEIPEFVVLNKVEINSVMFMYVGKIQDVNLINKINLKIYELMLNEGLFYVHKFPIQDFNGIIEKDAMIYSLRFMCGNPNTNKEDVINLVNYILKLGKKVETEFEIKVKV